MVCSISLFREGALLVGFQACAREDVPMVLLEERALEWTGCYSDVEMQIPRLHVMSLRCI